MKVEIFGREDCRFCAAARSLCDKSNIPYVYTDMTNNSDLIIAVMLRAKNASTVPQIFLGEHHIGGFESLQRAIKANIIQQIIGGQ